MQLTQAAIWTNVLPKAHAAAARHSLLKHICIAAACQPAKTRSRPYTLSPSTPRLQFFLPAVSPHLPRAPLAGADVVTTMWSQFQSLLLKQVRAYCYCSLRTAFTPASCVLLSLLQLLLPCLPHTRHTA